jgi:hypothetical protein
MPPLRLQDAWRAFITDWMQFPQEWLDVLARREDTADCR